jgi:hypothetical protein
MGGPTSQIRSSLPLTGAILDELDRVLAAHADEIERTRKGRNWAIRVDGSPIEVIVLDREGMQKWGEAADADTQFQVMLSAGCNSPEDYDRLTDLGNAIGPVIQGTPSPPTK